MFTARWGAKEDKDTLEDVPTCRISLDNLFKEEEDLLDYDEELAGRVKEWASIFWRPSLIPARTMMTVRSAWTRFMTLPSVS